VNGRGAWDEDKVASKHEGSGKSEPEHCRSTTRTWSRRCARTASSGLATLNQADFARFEDEIGIEALVS